MEGKKGVTLRKGMGGREKGGRKGREGGQGREGRRDGRGGKGERREYGRGSII